MHDIVIKNMMNFILYLAIKKPPEIISHYGSLTANIMPKRQSGGIAPITGIRQA
jgi:hypothetical protein